MNQFFCMAPSLHKYHPPAENIYWFITYSQLNTKIKARKESEAHKSVINSISGSRFNIAYTPLNLCLDGLILN